MENTQPTRYAVGARKWHQTSSCASAAATQSGMLNTLSDALAQAGQPVDHIEVDGIIHRYHPEGKHNGDVPCWYVAHWLTNGHLVAHFGDHRVDPAGKGTVWRSWEHFKSAPVDREAIAREQTERQHQAKQAKSRRQAEAAEQARTLWETLSETGESAYLAHKQVPALGVRFGQDRRGRFIAVPMRGPDGELRGLQRIYDDGTKQFNTGVAKKGAYHRIGVIEPGKPLYVAEGYATAASVHLATGYPVAVCFDAGNISPVLENLRKHYPEQLIGIAADSDQWKPAIGNTGETKAREAARHYGAFVAIPDFSNLDTTAKPTDFNDLHALAGLERVKRDLKRGELSWLKLEESSRNAKTSAANLEELEPPLLRAGGSKPHFTLKPEGVFWHGVDKDGQPLPPEWICSYLEIIALTRDAHGENWRRLLEFPDHENRGHRWAMPMAMLKGNGEELRGELLRLGLTITTSPRGKSLLSHYIQQARPQALARCVERTGWHDGAFVFPTRTLGERTERVLFQADTTRGFTYAERGTLQDWRNHVAALCTGNSRLVFALSCGFAAMLLELAGEDSGGFHLRGDSSTGKTRALLVAASIYGGPDYLQRWRATDNGLEALALQHTDTLLILDELAQIDARVAGEACYMLANGEGKTRASRSGAAPGGLAAAVSQCRGDRPCRAPA